MKSQGIVLGLIPARGGSKGVPGKNIKTVAGKPLIAHAIDCGLGCSALDRVIVSTDSEVIAKVARENGADVPFIRPPDLARDQSPMLPVMQHAIQAVESIYHERVDLLVLLDPTGPLRTPEDILAALKLIMKLGCDAVISGHPAHRNPYFNMVSPRGEFVQLVMAAESEVGRRQDAPAVYDLNTVVWVYKRHALMDLAQRIPEKTKLLQIPPERAVDLDSDLDFALLEMLMTEKRRTSSDAV